MPRTTPGSTSRGLPCGDTPPDIACPNRPDGRCRGASIPIEVLLISALGGYHFLGLVHDQPFQGVSVQNFISALAALAQAWAPQSPSG